MGTLTLREYTPQDTQPIILLITQVLRDQQVIPDTSEPVDDADLFRIGEIYSGRSRFWVCLDGDTLIGTVAIRERSAATARLNRMFVQTAYHGTGAGQALLDHALIWVAQQGFREVILNTHSLMRRAHRFYERNGFTRVAEDAENYHYHKIIAVG